MTPSKATPPKLPDPEEVARVLSSMREAIDLAYRIQQETIEEATIMVAEAQAEQKRLREAYPMFFHNININGHSPAHDRTTVYAAEAQNLILRVVAEHPGITRRRLAKLVNYSESWVSGVTNFMNDSQIEQVFSYGKHGRLRTYTLTPSGEKLVANGGVCG